MSGIVGRGAADVGVGAAPGKVGKTMKYPSDANGDVLRRMERSGDDLSRPRDVEFTVVFPNETAARQFADHVHTLGYRASAELTGSVQDRPWDVTVVRHMVPSHEEIGAFEELLQGSANQFGGRNDGWGCFNEPPSASD